MSAKVTCPADGYASIKDRATALVMAHCHSTRAELWGTSSGSSHRNHVVYDSDGEAAFCRVVEGNLKFRAYVKNHNLECGEPGLALPRSIGYTPLTHIS